ncbi:MAG: hypothetical protein JWP81_1347 [Ferruginibacter sp.]|nr:hypothetical protein [Ferruginibacter sp.]
MNTIIKRRIRIYTSVRQQVELAKKIYERHMQEGNSSLLCAMDGFSWDATGPKIIFCQEKHKEAINLNERAEEAYRQRDAVLAEITDIINVSKAILQTKYNFCPEKIRDWGFSFYDLDSAHKTPP